MTIRHFKHAALLTVALLTCTPQAQAAATAYSFETLGSLGGTFAIATAINDVGQIVGYAATAGDAAIHATQWSGGLATDLGTLGGAGSYSYAYDINNAGLVVGEAQLGSYSRATLWDGSTITNLGTLGGVESTAYAINDSGQIVGFSDLPSWNLHATLWHGNTMTDLGTLGGEYSSAQSINNAGQIVGTSYTTNNQYQRATLWNGATPTELSTAEGLWSGGHTINDAGVIVGRSDNRPVVWNGDTAAYLDSLGGTSPYSYRADTLAWSINNAGQVVGYAHTLDGVMRATLWDGTTILDLNQFLSADDINAGWELFDARDINNHGVIVGTANNRLTGLSSAFVLTPTAVPEPATWLIAFSGVLTMMLVTRRRRKALT